MQQFNSSVAIVISPDKPIASAVWHTRALVASAVACCILSGLEVVRWNVNMERQGGRGKESLLFTSEEGAERSEGPSCPPMVVSNAPGDVPWAGRKNKSGRG